MAKQRNTNSNSQAKMVTADRAVRLYRLLQILETGPKTRLALTRQLHLDVRGFYRDLELLRTAGIQLLLEDGRYQLEESPRVVFGKLPFPDPRLSLGEAIQLSKGRSVTHRKLKDQIEVITGAGKKQITRPASKPAKNTSEKVQKSRKG